ncbi:Ni/Fe-hydrogenase, b-type cytochrome subunit [candidate division KSB1 bacterium 4484_188]|nr:MAG: Ni/Fe-hydrogenase, b-type cytochrome subunit [candidate division KSB1 bacterium 4484_188]HFE63460.1 Ni/Fe-hydrogenase, b-type cytochrome subunit [Caldithrix sp.]
MANVKHSEFYQVYVWQIPVRVYHWVNAACVLVLAVTGYLIGKPLAIHSSAEASKQYWFGTIRFIHFATAYIFLFNYLFRIYWGFVGNRYSRFSKYLPVTRANWHEMLRVLRIDILQIRKGPLPSIGHNALAAFSYFILFLAFLFEVFTGFGLYAAMSKHWFAQMFAWIVPLMGGDFAVRQWHHAMMWVFVIFSLIHIYLVFYHDYVEGRGVTSSMVGGWKFIEKDEADILD